MPNLSALEIEAYRSRLRQMLASKGFTQTAFANEIGVDQSAVSLVASGKFRRRIGQFAKILDYVGLWEGAVVPEEAEAAFRRYVGVGGDVSLLARVVDLLGEAQTKARR